MINQRTYDLVNGMAGDIRLKPNESFNDPLVFGSVELMKGETLDEALDRMRRDTMPLAEDFCRMYDVEIKRIEWTDENGTLEPFYVFSDGFCYSPGCLRESVRD